MYIYVYLCFFIIVKSVQIHVTTLSKKPGGSLFLSLHWFCDAPIR